jgi:hypothetical protein
VDRWWTGREKSRPRPGSIRGGVCSKADSVGRTLLPGPLRARARCLLAGSWGLSRSLKRVIPCPRQHSRSISLNRSAIGLGSGSSPSRRDTRRTWSVVIVMRDWSREVCHMSAVELRGVHGSDSNGFPKHQPARRTEAPTEGQLSFCVAPTRRDDGLRVR